jgi:hypothetical protein
VSKDSPLDCKFAFHCSFRPFISNQNYYFSFSKPVADGVTSNFPTFQITINDTKPVWGYCGQTGHCQQGMVFSVNAPTSGNTFDAFRQLALKSNTTTSSTTSSSYSTATGSYYSDSTDHQIVVGGSNGQLVYTPPNINAKPGDTVTFSFRQKNHTGAAFFL